MRITSAFLPLAVVVVALSSSTVSSKAPADAAIDTVGSAQNSTVDIIASLEGSVTQFTDEDGNPIRYIESGGNPLGDDDDDDEEDEPAQRRGAPKKGKGRKKGKKVFKSKRAKLSKHQKAAKISSLISTKPPPSDMLLDNNIKTTWYSSHDLLNPACGTGDWNPTNNAHIGAISTNWKSGPKCGQFVDICNEKTTPNKCITVRRIDDCAGCKANHVDLTKAAFKSLSPSGGLDEGVLEGLKLYQHRTPNPWNGDLFGPIKLAL